MQGGKIRQISYNYDWTGSRFKQDLHFGSQYFNLYRHRLQELRHKIPIGEYFNISVSRITDVRQGQHVLVMGIIIRSHKSRASNIEKYIVKVGSMDPRPSLGNFCTPEDTIYIEDENGRLLVDTSHLESWTTLITGAIVGIRGIIKEDSTLEGHELLYPDAALPKPIKSFKDEYICFISGLEIGHPTLPHTLLHLLIDFFLGSTEDPDCPVSSKIVRLVILGDSIFKPFNARTIDRKAVGENELKGFQEMSSSLKQLDTFISELAGVFPVDLVPGELDPTNASLPQQALSPYLFPKASVYSALQSVPNPYEFDLDEVKFLCTSGQNINSLAQYVPEGFLETELMDLTMKYKHIAPTAPDALQCIPLQSSDPFIIQKLPNLYICGNLRKYNSVINSQGTRLISLPKFSSTFSFIILNRFTLEPTLITLQDCMSS